MRFFSLPAFLFYKNYSDLFIVKSLRIGTIITMIEFIFLNNVGFLMRLYRLFILVLLWRFDFIVGSESDLLLNQHKNLVPGEFICFKVQPVTSSYQSTSENNQEWRYTIPNKKKTAQIFQGLTISTNFLTQTQVYAMPISAPSNNDCCWICEAAANRCCETAKGVAVVYVCAKLITWCCGVPN